MFLTLRLLAMKKGWVPRSAKIPGNVYRGKKQRYKPVTASMRRSKKENEARIAHTDQMIEFPYLLEHETEVEDEVQRVKKEAENQQRWEKRILGKDVFGLGAGHPSMLDHLMVTDTRRYAAVRNGPLSSKLLQTNYPVVDEVLEEGGKGRVEELD